VRVLFIEDRPTGDWGMDLVWAGLMANVGPSNLYDYPAHEKHRRGIPVETGDPEKDWGAERGSLCYHHLYHDLPVASLSDVTEKLKTGFFDLIITDEREASFKRYLELRANFTDVPVVVVAGNDAFQNVSPEYVRQNYYKKNLRLMFLDNWKNEYASLPYARPYSWSLNFDHLWDRNRLTQNLVQKKVFDICFMGLTVSPHRRAIIDHVRQKWNHLNNCIVDERDNEKFDKFFLKQEYFERMAQSRICLNLRGDAESGKALRFYEIPYVGSFMLSQWFTNPQAPHFYTGVHCRFFDTLDEMDSMIEVALENDLVRETIAHQGHEFVMRYHTCQARVKQMLDTIRDAK
jgi:spore maturation protein CgeB